MDKLQLEELLAAMVRAGGSSLHLLPGRAPCVRVQRRFVVSEQAAVTAAAIDELTRDFLFEDHRQRLQRLGQVEVLYVARTGQRFRTTVTHQEDGRAVLMRPVPDVPPKLADLDLPAQIGGFTQFRSGLVLVTGFFGSGKSTTLAALVDKLNLESSRHVVTIEDPIEFLHQPGQALLHQREVSVHVGTTVEGVQQAVRVGADVVVVSDLHDGQALEAAFGAAESGCLVLAALDASSVIGACNEIPTKVAPEQRARCRVRFATCLRAIVAQTLLPRSPGKGRVPMAEILIGNRAVRKVIRSGQFHELPPIMQRCRGLGMQTADLALRTLTARHLVSHEEARQHALDRDQMLRKEAPAVAR